MIEFLLGVVVTLVVVGTLSILRDAARIEWRGSGNGEEWHCVIPHAGPYVEFVAEDGDEIVPRRFECISPDAVVAEFEYHDFLIRSIAQITRSPENEA